MLQSESREEGARETKSSKPLTQLSLTGCSLFAIALRGFLGFYTIEGDVFFLVKDVPIPGIDCMPTAASLSTITRKRQTRHNLAKDGADSRSNVHGRETASLVLDTYQEELNANEEGKKRECCLTLTEITVQTTRQSSSRDFFSGNVAE
ncbi:hypothetical protein ANTPLA_LOCUS9085 [Anthophora plagiata]